MNSTNAPSDQPAKTARQVALEVLRGATREGFVQDRLDRQIAQAALDRLEAGLATELVMSVVRRRLTLDHILARFLNRKLADLQPGLLDALRIGAAQMLLLERIPPFAAVDSSVELVKQHVGRKAAGLANAVLRRVAQLSGEVAASPTEDSKRAIPLDVQRRRLLNEAILPDLESHPAEYLSIATSHPRWLVDRWLGRFGPDATRQICLTGIMRPPLVLRPNERQITPKALARRLSGEGVGTATVGKGGAVFVEDAPPAGRLAVVIEGACQPQDVTAQGVAKAAGVKSGDRVLDLCAAPGTKTTQLAEMMTDDGLIIACDRTDEKLARIHESCERMGIACVRTVLAANVQTAIDEYGPFDVVLVDAPCSNTGVLARRPDARYRVNRKSLTSLTRIQAELLARGAGAVRAGGRLVYATCSIESEETELLVQGFLREQGGWRLEAIELTLPQCGEVATDWRDGGFHAVMRRAE